MLGVRACRWARARDPLKATSQPDWARSQLSTSACSHREVSAGRGRCEAGWGGAQRGRAGEKPGGSADRASGLSPGDKPTTSVQECVGAPAGRGHPGLTEGRGMEREGMERS